VPVEHYENFPVASVLLPARIRRPVEAIYWFARTADDIADEGTAPPAERLVRLSYFAEQLDLIESGGQPSEPLFVELATNIRAFSLPIGLLRDLLDAFSQDVTQTRYETFDELLDYCRRSANPIGRLMLHLYGVTNADQLRMSDQICSALQLINHWQDIAIDWRKNDIGRVYLPAEDLAHFGLSTNDIANAQLSLQWTNLMAFQTARARQMMMRGAPLSHQMTGRFGAELRLIVVGGLSILDKIDRAAGDIFNHRPVVSRWDWLRLAPSALLGLQPQIKTTPRNDP
jgi:squalene synthase HpnC